MARKQEIEIVPIGKPRMTKADSWKRRPCVQRYWDFKDKISRKYIGVLPETLNLEFILPMPKSWSKKKKDEMLGMPHKQKPDIDNIIKAVLDSLAKEDSYIWEITAKKTWGISGRIIFYEY